MKKIISVILSIGILFSAIASFSITASAENAVPNQLSGGFIQPWLYMSYSDADWDRELTELKKIGFDTLIMGDVVYMNRGAAWEFYYESKNHPEYANANKMGKTVEKLLEKAQQHDIDIILGLGMYKAWWDNADLTVTKNNELFTWFCENAKTVMDDLNDQFGEQYADTFKGWYFVPEIWNHATWNNNEKREIYANNLSSGFNTLIEKRNEITPDFKIMFSPFSTRTGFASKENTQKFYTSFFDKTNFDKNDVFVPMDNCGGGGQTVETLEEWTKAYSDAMKDSNNKLQFWSNTETFIQPLSGQLSDNDKWGACTLDRYIEQINIISKYVNKIYSFSYSHYFSPNNTVAGFHETYLDYLKTGVLEKNPPTAPTKIKTSTSIQNDKELLTLTWSGMTDDKGISRVNIYRNDKYYDYTLAIKKDGSGVTQYAPFTWTDKNPSLSKDVKYELEVIDCAGNVSKTKASIVVNASNKNNDVELDTAYFDLWNPNDPTGANNVTISQKEPMKFDDYKTVVNFGQDIFKEDISAISGDFSFANYFVKSEYPSKDILDIKFAKTEHGVGMQFINEKPIEIGRQCAVSVSTSDLLLPTRLLPDSKAILGNDPNNGLTFYVDNTNYSTDASFVLQFTEKDGVINPDTKTYGETRRTLKSNFPVYGQNEKGEFTKEFKKANGSIVVPQGYKGFVRIPFKSFQVAWGTPDLNNRVDLNKVNAFFFYKDEDGGKGSFIIDQIGFYGKDVMNVEKPITYGDVNDDGTINTLDALMILKHVAKSSILVDRALIAADYNQDKNVNTLDALKVLKKVAHLE